MTQNASKTASFLIFTDLDGSLLENENYSIEPAQPALAALARRGVTPIFASSKTAVEILAIQHVSGIAAPFIGENGAAVYDSTGKVLTAFGLPRESWLNEVHQLRERMSFKFNGFSDWSIKRIAELTGLCQEDADKARIRQFTEPMLWQDTQTNFQLFLKELQKLSLTTLEGGRFCSIQGHFDKSGGMKWWQAHCSESRPFLVAVGDSPNDMSLLAAADVAVIIKSDKSHKLNPVGPATVLRTRMPGPAGWNEGIKQVLNLLDSQQLLIL